ncbi:Fe-S cluster assembly protein SufD [Fulvitalea axinellae]|uniref:Fe-S cluster assembly protein SufD n=1 Tax=Fulvitalea axinellae TaxID=1182444 RepID=A0AAU9CMD7_9BACT|nr:Fe-S cluster assembly protein SufD [Fulvitalea axinellae]
MSQTVDKKSLKDIFLDRYDNVVASATGEGAVADIRKAAAEKLAEMGLPVGKDEEYKYFRITGQLEKRFDHAQTASAKDVAEQDYKRFLIEGLDANVLVFVDGQYSEQHSRIISPEKEIRIRDINKAIAEDADAVAGIMAKGTQHDDAYFLANTALFEGGVIIEVPKSAVVEKPTAIINISDSRGRKAFSFQRNIITVGENAQASFYVENNTVGEAISFQNGATEIFVADNANVKVYNLQNDAQAYQVNNTYIYQGKSSVATNITVSVEGAMVRNNLRFSLDGEHIESNMFGLSLLDGKSVVDHHTVADHTMPNCESNELYKGIFDGKSKGVFNGKIFVRQNAQKTNAFQSNKNILLSDDASVNTKPQLEIWADDVKCSHGCTNGQLEDEQLFYLRARGIGEEKARAMLLYAFAEDVVTKIDNEAIRTHIDKIIEARLIK